MSDIAGRLGPVIARPLLPSLFAWATTVAVPCLGPGVSWLARATAVLSLGAALGASHWMDRDRRLARRWGVFGFVGGCLLTWALLGEGPSTPRDRLRAVLGALGWLAFAFGWGAVRRLGTVPEDHPAVVQGGRPLEPRGALPLTARVALVIAVAGAASCLVLPWRVERASHAVLGHLLGLAAAVGLLFSAGKFALPRPAQVSSGPWRARVQGAVGPLVLLALVAVVGWAARGWVGG